MKHQKLLRSTTQVLCSTLVIVIVASLTRSVFAANGIQKTITFQGKVTNSSGTNVTDGTYDFIIKIYDGAGGGASTLFTENWTASALWSSTMSSAPSSGGTSLTYSSDTNEATIKVGQILWNTTKQESVIVTSVNTGTNAIGISPTRQAWNTSDTVTNKIFVKDGVFKVAINSLNQDLSGVNFNTDSIFMGVEFNSDGEMKPRIQYTATPYAFNSEKVNGLTVVNTSDTPFSSTTTLKIGDGKTVQIDNGLRFTGTDSTQFTFPNSSGTVVTLDAAQILTNKTIGSTGLTFSGATTDITTASNENFVISPNGTGRIGLGTTNPFGWLDIRSPHGTIPAASVSAITSFATFLIDQAGTGDIFAASSSGLARFSISNGGLLRLANGESIDNSTDNTIVLASDATNGAGALRLPVKSSSGDPSLNVGGNMYYNQSSGKFRCYQNTGWVDCIPSSNLQSASNTSINTLASGSETAIISANITPSTTTSQIWIVSTVEVRGDGNTNRNVTLTVKRGASCAAGVAIGTSMVVETDYAADNYTGALNFVDVPGSTTAQTYQVCATTDAGSPTTNAQNITLYEPNGGAVTAGSLTVRETDSSPAVASVATLEFGPTSTSTDEFIVSDQTGGVARVRIGNQVGMLNQNEVVTGGWSFTGGNVGIGTTNPTAKLEIASNLGTSPIASFSATTSSAGLIVDNSGLGDIITASSSGLTRFVVKQNGNIILSPNGGNVGIGTTSPAAVFDVRGDSSGLAVLGNFVNPNDNAAAVAALDLTVGTSAPTGWRIKGTQTLLQIGDNLLTNALNLNTNGSLGIGTTTPRATLDVNGNASVSGVLRFYSGDASIQATQNNNIYIGSTAGSSSTTGNVLITPIGNVGIGTTTPTQLLSVAGSANIAGSLTGLTGLTLSSGAITLGGSTGSGLCLTGGATASWGSCGSGSYVPWIQNNNLGTLYPVNSTLDIFFGGQATSSALFKFSPSGTQPTASIAANSSYAGLVIDNKGQGDLFTASSSGLNRFVIQQNGNVGIGITNPTSKLYVNGNSAIAGTVQWGGSGQGLLTTGGGGYPAIQAASTFGLIFNTNGANERLRIDANGNVGVGTTAPTSVLQIVGDGIIPTASASANTSFAALVVDNKGRGDLITASSSGLARFTINQNGNVGIGNGQALSAAVLNIVGDGNKTLFRADDNGNGDSTPFIINSSGNVGIGTTTPNTLLHILGLASTTPTASISARSSFTGLVVDNTIGDLFTASSSGLNRFVIKQNGSVGIGTTNPDNLLHLNSINTQSFIRFTNSTTGSSVSDGGSVGMAGNNLNFVNSEGGTFNFNGPSSVKMTIDSASGNVGIGTTTPTAILQVLGVASTTPTASVSARSSFVGLVVDNTIGDLLTASSSGLTRFVVTQNGSMGLGLSNPTAAKFVLSDSSQAPGVDMMQISATTGTSTNGVDGLQIDFANTGASASTNAGLTVNVTSNNSNASSNLYGITIGDLTSGGESASEVALNIGTGWDKGIVIGSGGSTNSGLVYTGAGRPTKTITLSPEFAGAILTASGSATTNGSMTSDASPSAALSNYTTYYQWTSSQTSLQDYTVAVRVTLPQDFSAWTTSNALQVNYNTSLTTIDTNKLDVFVYNPDSALSAQNAATPVAYYQANKSGTAKTWTTLTIDDSDLTDNGNAITAAGKTVVIYLKMYAKDNNYVQVGDIVLNYLAAF